MRYQWNERSGLNWYSSLSLSEKGQKDQRGPRKAKMHRRQLLRDSEDSGVRDDMVALLPRVDSNMATAVTQNNTDTGD